MLYFAFLALLIPSQASLFSNVLDYFFDSFDGDKYENVGIGQTIECGEDKDGEPRDCLILCDKTNSCANSTFKVSRANIQIICQMPSSCANVYISAYQTQSLNMSFTASNAFLNGFYIGTDNERVITQCSFGEACKYSTFYYQDHDVIHNCSSWNGEWSSHGSCRHSAIVALRGKFTLDISNSQGFYPGTFYGYDNDQVTTYCRSASACESAVFHYDSFVPVKHYCMEASNSCAGATIHALTRTDIDCAGKQDHSSTYSCYSLSVVSPTNNYSVAIHGYDYAPKTGNRMILYLVSGGDQEDPVVCEDDCLNDRVVYYAANDYNHENNCSMENDCLDDLRYYLQNNPFTVYDNYYYDTKGFVEDVWNGGPLLVLHSRFPLKRWNEITWMDDPQYKRTSLTAPKGLDDNEYMVFCIDCKTTDICLGNAANAVIFTTLDEPNYSSWIEYSYIEASFDMFTYYGSSTSRNISINATQANEVNIKNIGWFGNIYLGDVMDVNIDCTWSKTCIGVDIYSDINPIEEQALSENSEFNVNCSHVTYGEGACAVYSGYPSTIQYGLYLHFSSLNKKCRIDYNGPDTNDCPFLAYAVRSGVTVTDTDSKSIPVYVYGLIAGGAVVVLIVASCVIYIFKKKNQVKFGFYENLSDDNQL